MANGVASVPVRFELELVVDHSLEADPGRILAPRTV
jgi:hypothetical protein